MPALPQDSLRVAFSGRLLLLGFGIIGQGILPLLFRHIEMPRERISILAADAASRELAEAEAGRRRGRGVPPAPGRSCRA